jgi:hypothetical protein
MFGHLLDHLQSAGEGKSGMLMGVHPGLWVLGDWGFGDSQSLKPHPDEHPTQRIEASQLGIAWPDQE